TSSLRDWSSDVCSSDLGVEGAQRLRKSGLIDAIVNSSGNGEASTAAGSSGSPAKPAPSTEDGSGAIAAQDREASAPQAVATDVEIGRASWRAGGWKGEE